jgi:hypothetical protein
MRLFKQCSPQLAHLQGVIDNEGNRMRGFFDAGSWIEYLEVHHLNHQSFQ